MLSYTAIHSHSDLFCPLRLVVSLIVKQLIYVLVVRPVWLLCDLRVCMTLWVWVCGEPRGKAAQQLREASKQSTLPDFLSVHLPSPKCRSDGGISKASLVLVHISSTNCLN